MNQPRPTPPPRKRVPPPAAKPAVRPPAHAPLGAGAASASSGSGPVFIGLAIGLGVILVPAAIIGLAYVVMSGGGGGATEQRSVTSTPTDDLIRPRPPARPEPSETNDAVADADSFGSDVTETADEVPTPASDEVTEVEEATQPGPPPEMEPDEPDATSQPAVVSRPLDDVRSRGQRLLLPDIVDGTGEPGVELAAILVEDPADCQLNIVTAGSESGGQSFTIEAADEEGLREWTVLESSPIAGEREVGRFRLAQQALSFEWTAGNASDRLRSCLLEVVVTGNGQVIDRAVCQLTEPITADPLELRFNGKQYALDFEVAGERVSPADLPLLEAARLELTVAGLDADRLRVAGVTPLRAGRFVTIQVSPPDGSTGGFLELEVRFDAEADRVGLHVKNFAHVPTVMRQGSENLNASIGSSRVPYSDDEHRRIDQRIEGFSNLVDADAREFAEERQEVQQKLARLVELDDSTFLTTEQRQEMATLQIQAQFTEQQQETVDKLRADLRSARVFLEEIERTREFLESSLTLDVRLLADIDGREVEFLRTAAVAAAGTDGEATE